ncbi:MAG: glycerophosphodiester phosphodiesterase [Actinobacteria bacterium]|uniref:Unannotated protein n=1 Tax=freshwater metagenome TaxID=449393 RepID=A0A6J6QLB9_9ZZZZ|nr:glycerophosphodiester phosphodiesterase [Actinomycetota bacterium]
MTSPTTGHPYLDRVLEQPGAVLAFAHRGGGSQPEIEGLENTRTAFEHAVALGYDYLETDVRVTRDGTLVAFHDPSLDRVSDGTGQIASLSYAQVSDAKVGGRERVPTFEELFEAFPHACFNIDLKSEASVPALAAFVAAHDTAAQRILVGSFSVERMRAFRLATAGRVPTSAHPLEVAVFALSPSGRLARLLTRGRVAALQVPHRLRVGRLRIRLVTPSLVRRVHAAGAHVHVWTVDEPDEMRLLLDAGVDGLVTDRTDVLRAVLVERGQWRGPVGGAR